MQRTRTVEEETFRPSARYPGMAPAIERSAPACQPPADVLVGSGIRATIEPLVAQIFGILNTELRAVTRGRARAALARQVAMYLTHVVCQLSLTDAGRVFARDRTTVAHACSVVEDLRDDPNFDRVMDLIEAVLLFRMKASAAFAPRASEVRAR